MAKAGQFGLDAITGSLAKAAGQSKGLPPHPQAATTAASIRFRSSLTSPCGNRWP